MQTKTILVLIFVLKVAAGANILYVTRVATPSHHIWNRVLALELVQRGHNVTMLSHDVEKAPAPANFTLIQLEGLYEISQDHFDLEAFTGSTVLESIKALYGSVHFACEHDLKTRGLETLLNYPKDYRFDLIIFDVAFGQYLYPLIERFHDPPSIGVTPLPLPPGVFYTFGNHFYTSYMPHYGTMFSDRMNIFERFLNMVYVYYDIMYRNYITSPIETKFVKERFGENVSSLEELERRISLLLANTDPVLEYPVALPPNIIPVGGLHVQPAKQLPEDLRKIIDGAKQGVILFSLGTNVRSDELELHQRQAFLDAFEKLPHVVLWKFESDGLERLPKNVIIRKWLPQNDILGHPNTKLFISHGGALSTQESTYHGVPVVGIPFFMDQHANVARMARRKLAVHLELKELTTDKLYSALQEVLNNPIYKDNMKEASKRHRDQPETPLERAVFWVEYVLRHGGAHNLALPARDMSVFVTANIDIVVVFFGCIFAICYFLRWTFRVLIRLVSFRRTITKKKIN